MRDAAEATILVTGATDGLGRRVAQELARRGATVLVHGRSPERLEDTLEELRGQMSTEKVGSYVADFSSLAAVRDLADRILSEYDRLDVLVNNAGIIVQEHKESEDGYELTFAVNYLSHFLLTSLLLPLLKDSAPARVVNVASAAQSPIDFDDPMLERGYDAMRAYSQSKLAQIMFTFGSATGSPSGPCPDTWSGVRNGSLWNGTVLRTRCPTRCSPSHARPTRWPGQAHRSCGWSRGASLPPPCGPWLQPSTPKVPRPVGDRYIRRKPLP